MVISFVLGLYELSSVMTSVPSVRTVLQSILVVDVVVVVVVDVVVVVVMVEVVVVDVVVVVVTFKGHLLATIMDTPTFVAFVDTFNPK